MGIGAAMAGGNPTQGRNEGDFYPTPAECTIGLLNAEADYLLKNASHVWECACGDGGMAEIIKSYNFEVSASDLTDRGYGEIQDFFAIGGVQQPMAIITNPPFNLAQKFIEHALGTLEVPYLALLLKSSFWHAKRRYDLFTKHTPSVIYPMTWRPDFMDRGRPTMECMWVVWDKNRTETTQYIPMLKPE